MEHDHALRSTVYALPLQEVIKPLYQIVGIPSPNTLFHNNDYITLQTNNYIIQNDTCT